MFKKIKVIPRHVCEVVACNVPACNCVRPPDLGTLSVLRPSAKETSMWHTDVLFDSILLILILPHPCLISPRVPPNMGGIYSVQTVLLRGWYRFCLPVLLLAEKALKIWVFLASGDQKERRLVFYPVWEMSALGYERDMRQLPSTVWVKSVVLPHDLKWILGTLSHCQS